MPIFWAYQAFQVTVSVESLLWELGSRVGCRSDPNTMTSTLATVFTVSHRALCLWPRRLVFCQGQWDNHVSTESWIYLLVRERENQALICGQIFSIVLAILKQAVILIFLPFQENPFVKVKGLTPTSFLLGAASLHPSLNEEKKVE